MLPQGDPIDPGSWPWQDCPHELREQVKLLQRDDACIVWQQLIEPPHPIRHPMQLPADHWTSNGTLVPGTIGATPHEQLVATWQREVQTGHEVDPTDQPCFFIAMAERSHSLPWNVFLHVYPWLLMIDDECPILVLPESATALVFSPHGSVRVCRR